MSATLNASRITFIGAGNMASAMAGGLLQQGVPATHITLTDVNDALLAIHSERLGVNVTQDNAVAVADADVVILAVKPQVMADVVKPLAGAVAKSGALVISIAAGIRTATLAGWLGANHPIVRCMPNTPALVGAGATGLYATAAVGEAQRQLADAILRSTGIVEWLANEDLLDAVTAVSGSGPAYFFLVMEAMIDAAQALGLDADASRNLVLQTALGAATMATRSDVDVVELRRRVTSPGGTTQAAIECLEKDQLRAIFTRALTAARDRSIELG